MPPPVAQRHQRQRTAAVVAEVFENGAAFGGVDDVAVDAEHRIWRHLDRRFHTDLAQKLVGFVIAHIDGAGAVEGPACEPTVALVRQWPQPLAVDNDRLAQEHSHEDDAEIIETAVFARGILQQAAAAAHEQICAAQRAPDFLQLPAVTGADAVGLLRQFGIV